MDILSYLSELIQTRKSVGIAGLGTIYKKKVPGRYDASAHAFVPPSYTLHFTEELKEDVLLAQYISKQRNVSGETANYFINEFSADLLKQFNNQQEVEFGEFGKLVKKDRQIELEAAEQINFGFDFYGLPAIKNTGQTETAPAATVHETEQAAEEIIPELQDVEEPVTDITLVPEPAAVPEEVILPEPAAVPEEVIIPEPVVVTPQHLPVTAPVIEEYQVEEELVPEPEDEPTVASVSFDNERQEENPGDEIRDTVNQDGNNIQVNTQTVNPELPENKVQDEPAKTVVEDEAKPEVKNTESDASGISRNDEQQLRSEIEALNYYRAQSPVNKATISEQEEVISKLNQQPAAQFAAESATAQPSFYASAAEEENKAMPLFLKIIMGLLISVIMMAIAYYVKPEWFYAITGNKATVVQKAQTAAPTVVVPPVDSAITTVPQKDTLPKAAVIKKDTLATAPLITQSTGTAVVYEIIGASMHDQKEADGFIAQMKKSGITAKVVSNMSGKRLKMSIATLKDEASAKLEMERLSKKLKIPGIYIYRNKQK